MTMRELALLANVSISTISKAFSDAEDISYETKKEIFDLAKKYGCFGKFYKGKYKKKIIAIIAPEFKSSFYANYIEILQTLIEKNNCIPLVSTDHFNTNIQSELMEYYISYLKVDGIIVFGIKEELKKGYDIPIVALFNSCDTSIDNITINTSHAFYETLDTLISLGHKKIAFIGEKLTRIKAENFKKIISTKDNIEGIVIESKYRFEQAGEDGIKKLISKHLDFTAIICAYDNIAIGAIKELKKHGKKVPEDYSVIGSDNIDATDYLEVSLSSIGIDTQTVCNKAWELMSKKLKNQYYHNNKPIIINGKFLAKESISKPKEQKYC